MKILVTGHHGFIGHNLVHHLRALGHTVDGWEWHSESFPCTQGYDWCIHTGAISSTTYTDVDQILKQNFDFSVDLAHRCNQTGTNLQYASSASVYGPTIHFTEDGAVLPQSPYAWSKYLFDRYVIEHATEWQNLIQGFRYFNVYGPGEQHKGDQASPYTKFVKQATKTGIVTLFEGSEHFKRDFVCVEDICRVHELMFDTSTTGIFNIGTGTAVSFDTVGKAIAQKYAADLQYIPMPENLKAQYQKYTCANLKKLNSVVKMEWTTIEDYINGTTN